MAGQDHGVGAVAGEEPVLDGADDRREVAAIVGVAGSAGEQGVAGQKQGGALDCEAHRPGGVARGQDGADAELAHLEHGVVVEEQVVGGEHGGVGGRYRDADAGVSDRADRLDVVPVPVGLDDLVHPQALAHLEQRLVLVCRVDEHGLATLAAAQHVDVVVNRTDHHAMELTGGVLPDLHEFGHGPRIPQWVGGGHPAR